jgi:DNA-binding CsgD family transcriptional regulator
VGLNEDERSKLTTLAARPKSAQALAQRARIVLRCAEGMSNTQVARELRVTVQTVGKWRRRFLRLRLTGLTDAPRSGAPRRRREFNANQSGTNNSTEDADVRTTELCLVGLGTRRSGAGKRQTGNREGGWRPRTWLARERAESCERDAHLRMLALEFNVTGRRA